MKRLITIVVLASAIAGCSTIKSPYGVGGSTRIQPGWTDSLINSQIASCEENFVGSTDPATTCTCYVSTYATIFTPDQVNSSSGDQRLQQIFQSCGQ